MGDQRKAFMGEVNIRIVQTTCTVLHMAATFLVAGICNQRLNMLGNAEMLVPADRDCPIFGAPLLIGTDIQMKASWANYGATVLK